jgi:iron complex outermembrane receptor protein
MQPNDLNNGWNFLFTAPVFGNVAWDDRFITNDTFSNYSRYEDPVTGRLFPNINNMEHWGVSATLEWKLNDDVKIKSITGYRKFWNKFGRDSDGSPIPVDATYDDSRHRQFTQEFQLTGTAGQLDWATGAFYYDAHDSNVGYNFLYTTFIYEQDSNDQQDTQNWAVFAQGTYHMNDKLSFIAGLRYTDDQKDATIYRASFFGDVTIPNQFVPTSATNTDYTLAVNYQWTDDVFGYIRYATGFKGGGFSPRPSNPLQTVPFEPEHLKTLEIGAKTELLERKMRLNYAAFYSHYLDQQTFAQQLDSSGANWFREVNAGKAHIWGLELELQAEPIAGLRIDGSAGYINYNLIDNEGNELLLEGDNCGGDRCYSPRTPKFNGALGVQYSFGTGRGSITPRLDLQSTSKIYFSTNNTGVQDAYSTVNGRITWASQDGGWEIAAYGNNLTDEEYFNGKLSLVGFFGREQGNPAAPRTWGLSMKHNFK